MNRLDISKTTRKTKIFLLALAGFLALNAVYSTITFHQTGTPVEIFDKYLGSRDAQSVGLFTAIHLFNEVFYYFVLIFFYFLMAVLAIAIDSNPKAQEQSLSFPKPIRWAISLVVAVVIIFGLGKSGAISANTAVLLAFPVLIAALVVLFLKRKDI